MLRERASSLALLLRASILNGLFPLPFQLLFENLGWGSLVGFDKSVERQRSDHGHHVGIDRIERKCSTGLHREDEPRLRYGRSHTPIGKANAVGNLHRAAVIDGHLDAWLQEKSWQNPNLEPLRRRIFSFDQIDLQSDLTRVPLAANGRAANHFRINALPSPKAHFFPVGIRKIACLLLPACRNFLLGEIGRSRDVAKRYDLLAARGRHQDRSAHSNQDGYGRPPAHRKCARTSHRCLSRNLLTRGAQIRTASAESMKKWPSSPKSDNK